MRNPRFLAAGGILLVLAVVLLWQWISGWGLVTINVKDAPLSKVIHSIESQGMVKIATNADLSTPVTFKVTRVTAPYAIDLLANRIDSDARLAYITAPTKGRISEALASFSSNAKPGGWAVFSSFGGIGGIGGSDAVPDARKITWKVSDSPEKTLQALLSQGSQKTGNLFAAPEEWNPAVSKLPSSGKVGHVIASLTGQAKGTYEEVFLLTVHPPRPDTPPQDQNAQQDDGGRSWGGSGGGFFSSRRGGSREMNSDWVAERTAAQIALLPTEEQAEAKKQMDEMRKFWDSVRNLPEAERRAKIEEAMSTPAAQTAMEERSAARDAKRSPEQREQRMRSYIQRKEAVKGAPAPKS